MDNRDVPKESVVEKTKCVCVRVWVRVCVQNMLRLRQVDTVTASELRNMQEVLVSKETEVVQSESTARGLTTG